MNTTEIPKGITKEEIHRVLAIKLALDTLVANGIMPDVDMDVQKTDKYIDRWFNVTEHATMCITNEEGESPHLADVIELWSGDDDTDIETFSADDLWSMLRNN